jgi:hypothetical protein
MDFSSHLIKTKYIRLNLMTIKYFMINFLIFNSKLSQQIKSTTWIFNLHEFNNELIDNIVY